jgi:hypothetical protein
MGREEMQNEVKRTDLLGARGGERDERERETLCL